MQDYKITSNNYRNFTLSIDDKQIGSLTYPSWYSFKAEIILDEASSFSLQPKGFWDSTIELKNQEDVLLSFSLGWQGIVFNVKNNNIDESFLLKRQGILDRKYVLLDSNEQEILGVNPDFNWSKMKLDYTIETTDEFEKRSMKEAFILSIIHSINYQMTMFAAGA